MFRLTASDFHTYFQPETCEARVYLQEKEAPRSKPSPYIELLKKLGLRFEQEHLAEFKDCINLSGRSREDREEATQAAVLEKKVVIYQAALKASVHIDSTEVEVVGDPDFILYENGAYIIRDVKLARRINETDHPEILRQLELYGWLFEQTFGIPPTKLEVFSSKKELVRVEYDGGKRALSELERIYKLKYLNTKPYSPVGWTKCSPCSYKNHCWSIAEAEHDVALVSGVDQNLARALRIQGIRSFDDLLSNFDEESLANFKRPWGTRTQKVGKSASSILRMAHAMASDRETLLEQPKLPPSENYVMLDLEGLPPQMDELQKIYLWGTQVFGSRPGQFLAATADFDEAGDRSGWDKFLENAELLFGQFGEIPFIHWHHYEKTNIEMYIGRFGDPSGTAERILENMVDILPLVKRSIALPLPTYSLKAVEKYVGFERTQDEYGGDWSIAKYIEATETKDPQLRSENMNAILTYNREDLAATWAVFDWFRKKFK